MGVRTQQWNSVCPLLLKSLQLPKALFLPPSPSLNSSLSPFLLPNNLGLPCSASLDRRLLYLPNSQDISLSICTPPSITPHSLMSLILDSPPFTSLSVARQAFLPLVLLVSALHFGMLGSHQDRGVITKAIAKRLTTCHEKIAECQGLERNVNHCVHPASKAWRTGLPRLSVEHKERVGRLGLGLVVGGGFSGCSFALLPNKNCMPGVLLGPRQQDSIESRI